jgi:hypothetical protein
VQRAFCLAVHFVLLSVAVLAGAPWCINLDLSQSVHTVVLFLHMMVSSWT